MHEHHTAGRPAEEYREVPEDRPSIYRILAILASYRNAIGLGLLAVMVAYVIVAAILLLRAPSQRFLVLPFRLDFSGAGQGQYPNGLKFTSGDIVAAPVATAAFQRNGLDRFMSLQTFLSSLVVIESNAALEKLTSEYRARLADARLTAVDRERISAEFEQRAASLNKNEWALSLSLPDKSGNVPPTLAKKALRDILTLWAEDTARRRKALEYQIPVLTAKIFAEDMQQDELVIALATLRSRISSVISNIEQVSELPGADLIRSSRSNRSLAELNLFLSDLLRGGVEPLIAEAFDSGAVRNVSATIVRLEAQRDYDARRLAASTQRADILRAALIDYVAQQPPPPRVPARADSRSPQQEDNATAGETLMPQLSDTFLDRLVNIASNSADRAYRQRMVDEIRDASLETVPLQAAVAFDDQVIAQARGAGSSAAAGTEARLRARYEQTRAETIAAVNEMNEIYAQLSRNLHPSAQLYTVTGPISVTLERTLSPMRVALGGLIAFLLALPLLCLAAIVHHHFTNDSEGGLPHESIG